MPDAQHSSTWAGLSGRLWVALGWLAILFPATYLLVVGWDSGEHAGVVVGFGLLVSAILAAVWTVVWFACGRLSPADRRAIVGAGASVSLAGSIIMGNITDQLAVAALTYAVLTTLVVFAMAVRHAGTTTSST